MLVHGSVPNPLRNVFERVTGSAVALQFPTGTLSCLQARLQAHPDNSGVFFIGTDGIQTWALDAGQETSWFLINDLAELYHINPSGTIDYLNIWLQR
jgi:hypothetical protein